jgi:hypothetical protein
MREDQKPTGLPGTDDATERGLHEGTSRRSLLARL